MEEPAGRPPAPGSLVLVQAFVNTNDLEGDDELGTPEALATWLVERGLLRAGDKVGGSDLRRAVEVREALRALLLANHGEPLAGEAVAQLNRAGERARLAVRFDETGAASLGPVTTGVDGALATILGVVHTAMAEGTWTRLKACRRPSCQWAFYDSSRNRSGAWCAMAVCGNRTKGEVFRRRHREPTEGAPATRAVMGTGRSPDKNGGSG